MNFIKLAFASAFAICKLPFNKVKNKYLLNILTPILIIFTFFLLILVGLLLLPFITLRGLVYVYLKLKNGKQFVKMCNYVSSVFCQTGHGTINLMLYINCKDANLLEDDMRRMIQSILDNVPEFSSEIKKTCGYYYLLRKQLSVNDVFSILNFCNDKNHVEEKILTYLAHCDIHRGPLFQIKLVKTPVKRDRYVLVVLVHHSITDAFGIFCVVNNYIHDRHLKQFDVEPKTIVQSEKRLSLNKLYVDLDSFIIRASGMPTESKSRHMAVFSEENSNYIPKLKALRKTFNCDFNELMISLIMYNLCQFMKIRLSVIPKIITMSFIRHLNPEFKQYFRNGQYENIQIDNNSIISLINAENLEDYNNFSDFISYIHMKSQRSISSMALQIATTVSHLVLTPIPDGIYGKIIESNFKKPIIAFSNMGVFKESYIGGRKVINFIGNMEGTNCGMFVGFLSYNNKLQIGLGSRLSFLESHTDLQKLLNCTIGHIDSLYNEFCAN